MPANKQNIDSELLRQRLKLKSIQSERKLLESHSSASAFFEKHKLHPGKIREHAAKLLTSGALAGTLLVSSHTGSPLITQNQQTVITSSQEIYRSVTEALATVLPSDIQTLTSDQEKKVSEIIKKYFGVNATAELEGNKLNDDYGRMGAEQHLPRWPGDSASAHEELVEKGITPGLGGWGYVPSDIEKYYVAVQTLYLPNWKTDTKKLAEWYKYRRVVVVNPANGKAIVAAVADAGPSIWTGKKFGGSPEVMQYLGIDYGMQNHPVVLFFLDDQNKEIPLGPLEYNMEEVKLAEVNKA